MMIAAFVSGSFQTGRSTIAAHLAVYLQENIPVTLLDCDIEQVTGAVLLPPAWSEENEIKIISPELSLSECEHCLRCLEKCKAGVFRDFKGQIIVLPERCMHCEDCLEFCKGQAVKLKELTLGTIHKGKSNNLTVIEARLNDSAVKASSLLYHTKSYIDPLSVTLVDTAPLTSEYACCSTMCADYFVLVTGDSSQYLKELERTITALKEFKKPFGVLINLSRSENCETLTYCKENNIPLLGVFPFDEDLDKDKASQCNLVEKSPKWRKLFENLWERILEEVSQ